MIKPPLNGLGLLSDASVSSPRIERLRAIAVRISASTPPLLHFSLGPFGHGTTWRRWPKWRGVTLAGLLAIGIPTTITCRAADSSLSMRPSAQ